MISYAKTLVNRPLFPYLFSIYPSLALLATNIREVEMTAVIRPLLLTILGTFIFNVLVLSIIKDRLKTALITTIILAVFFTYGHIVRILVDSLGTDHEGLIEIATFIIAVPIVVITLFLILNTKQDMTAWSKAIGATSIILVLFPIIQISTAQLGQISQSRLASGPANPLMVPIDASENHPGSLPSNQYPDIFYIILDGYSRADTLEALGFDNSSFLRELEDLGFYIATCSTSNYRATMLSMPAALNMDYLWDAIPNSGGKDTNSAPVYEALVHNRVRNELKQNGYKIISFQTGYQWDEWTDADFYVTPTNEHAAFESGSSLITITPFEYIYLRNTALYPFVQGSRFATQRYYEHYNRVIFTLEELPNIALIPGPKFVYAHIMAPHHPFVFLPDGSLNTDSRYYDSEKGYPSNTELFETGYLNSIKFLNSEIPNAINEIIHNSNTPPVIILQGDHGFVIPERRYNILNAYFLPGLEYDGLLYPSISPVNSFRIVFNQYLDGNLKLRDDLRINADIGAPYRKGRVKPFPETCP